MATDREQILSVDEIAAMRREIDENPQAAPIRTEWDVRRIVATLEMFADTDTRETLSLLCKQGVPMDTPDFAQKPTRYERLSWLLRDRHHWKQTCMDAAQELGEVGGTLANRIIVFKQHYSDIILEKITRIDESETVLSEVSTFLDTMINLRVITVPRYVDHGREIVTKARAVIDGITPDREG